MKAKLNPALTKSSARVIRLMIEDGEDLVTEGIVAYVGCTRTSIPTVYHLLRECLIRDVSDQNSKLRRYELSDDAERALGDPAYQTRWREHLRTGKSVTR